MIYPEVKAMLDQIKKMTKAWEDFKKIVRA